MTESAPLQIDASPVPYQLVSLVRQALPPLVAFAVGRGWLADDSATLLLALVAIALPIIQGQRHSLQRSRALARLAAIVPNAVAVVR
ncbi:MULTISPECIES: Pam3-gp28 family putative phage holin [unclassified Sphingomonas]|uniref:Pam3-gp28 family putative phage holin n=1 Tax=Novosphingobium rhizosphaerae TaxID=1551649 RepID=UPI0015C884FD